MSTFWLAAIGIFVLGLCAGSVYVLGFTLLQEHTEDDLRGRIFATLLTLVRLCVLLALVLGPFLATIFNGFARAATGAAESADTPRSRCSGSTWRSPVCGSRCGSAALIIIGAGFLAAKSMRMGLRSDLRSALGARSSSDERRANHPTSGSWTAPFGGSAAATSAADASTDSDAPSVEQPAIDLAALEQPAVETVEPGSGEDGAT